MLTTLPIQAKIYKLDIYRRLLLIKLKEVVLMIKVVFVWWQNQNTNTFWFILLFLLDKILKKIQLT